MDKQTEAAAERAGLKDQMAELEQRAELAEQRRDDAEGRYDDAEKRRRTLNDELCEMQRERDIARVDLVDAMHAHTDNL